MLFVRFVFVRHRDIGVFGCVGTAGDAVPSYISIRADLWNPWGDKRTTL